MKIRSLVMTLSPLLWLASDGHSAASPTTPAFYGDPPDANHPWSIHDRNRPQPKRVEPGTPMTATKPGTPPSDAIVLFDGTAASLAKWEADTKEGPPQPTKWIVNDGALECVPKSGYIRSKEQFGDVQLHVEWAAPKNVQGESQGRGNSGIFLMGLAEVQVLDNYNNPTYSDGFATSYYGVNPPLANALHPPGEYQSIDIIFRRPVYKDGKVVDAGYLTVFCNGVLVQDHTPLEGPGGHLRRSVTGPFPEKGPLKLQDHGNPVRFRNIWVRPLPPRSVEGGTEGFLTAEATTAKRKQIAADIRADAATLKGKPHDEMLRLAESLIYENDSATARTVQQKFETYAAGLGSLSKDQLEGRKGEILNVLRILRYMDKHKLNPAKFGPLATLATIEKTQGWEPPQKQKQKAK